MERPIADVFAAFVEPAKLMKWRRGLERVEQLSGRRDQQGSRCRLHFAESGNDYEILEEIISCRPHDEYAYRLVHDRMIFDTTATFGSRETGTAVRMRTRIRGTGLFWKVLLLFIRPTLRIQQEHDCKRLKKYCERPWAY